MATVKDIEAAKKAHKFEARIVTAIGPRVLKIMGWSPDFWGDRAPEIESLLRKHYNPVFLQDPPAL